METLCSASGAVEKLYSLINETEATTSDDCNYKRHNSSIASGIAAAIRSSFKTASSARGSTRSSVSSSDITDHVTLRTSSGSTQTWKSEFEISSLNPLTPKASVEEEAKIVRSSNAI